MAPHVIFSETIEDNRVSFRPFEVEWKALEKAKAVKKDKETNLITLNASNMEYLIPKAFRILFILIMLLMVLFSCVNCKKIYNSSTLEVKEKIEQKEDKK